RASRAPRASPRGYGAAPGWGCSFAPDTLLHREDFASVAGDEDRVLELRRELPVRRPHRPAVTEDDDLGRAEVDHRLDREAHAGLEPDPPAGSDVRDVRILVHPAPDAVASEVPDDRAALSPREL